MYNESFGLKKNPFRMTPEPAFLYLTPRYREALAGLTYAILDRKGFAVLTGEAGTGKTTLLTRFLEAVPGESLQMGVILNPTLTPDELLESLLLEFGIKKIPSGKPRRLMLLNQHLLKAEQAGKVCALIIDEAHKLTPELLEEIRLIGNMEHASQKLLQIVLLGQEGLVATLNRDDLRQLKQRIAVRLTLAPLSPAEVEQYVQHRWSKAEATHPLPFDAESLAALASRSQGIPRVINAVCDNALMLVFAEGEKTVSARHILSACQDLDLGPAATLPAPVAPAPKAVAPEPAPPADPVSIRVPEAAPPAESRRARFLRWAGKPRVRVRMIHAIPED